MNTPWRVADVFRSCWSKFDRTHRLPPHVARAAEDIQACRTAELGGHLYVCDHCGSEKPVYNSCKNRNCPTCQNVEKENWLSKQLLNVLPVSYYHVVFTLPHDLNGLINANRILLFNLLFTVSNRVLQCFARDPQWRLEGELGVLSVLHTWNQRLHQHIHVHCLVPGLAWNEKDQTVRQKKSKWLFKKPSLAIAFRDEYIKQLKKLYKKGKLNFGTTAHELCDPEQWAELIHKLEHTTWVVYPKHVPATPEKALEYLARYTHRVAIGDRRIQELSDGEVTFTWRDRSDGNTEKPETIDAEDFVQRFLQHILPPGFKKIRCYGWLSNAKRKTSMVLIRQALGAEQPKRPEESIADTFKRRYKIDLNRCPACNKGQLEKQHLMLPPAQAPPC